MVSSQMHLENLMMIMTLTPHLLLVQLVEHNLKTPNLQKFKKCISALDVSGPFSTILYCWSNSFWRGMIHRSLLLLAMLVEIRLAQTHLHILTAWFATITGRKLLSMVLWDMLKLLRLSFLCQVLNILLRRTSNSSLLRVNALIKVMLELNSEALSELKEVWPHHWYQHLRELHMDWLRWKKE